MWWSLPVTTAAMVVSDPVPAVVGTAMSGGMRRRTFKSPASCESGLSGRAGGAAAAGAPIHKMTGRPAAVLGMKDRGVLTPGAQADINVFAPEDLREPGTYQDPCRMAEGLDTVLVAGQPVIDGGQYTGVMAGQIVRRS